MATIVLVATGAVARPTPWIIRMGTIHHSDGKGIHRIVDPTKRAIPSRTTRFGPDFSIHFPDRGLTITPARPNVAIITPISQASPPNLTMNSGTTIKREKNPASSRCATNRFNTKSLFHSLPSFAAVDIAFCLVMPATSLKNLTRHIKYRNKKHEIIDYI